MATYTQLIYQIVFGTKYREHTLDKGNRDRLFKYIAKLLDNKNCELYEINGIEDHIHIVTHIHPSIALADLVKDIKLSSSEFIKSNELFPKFDGWQQGYGAFSYSMKEKDRLIAYVQNQEAHHRKKTFRKEYIKMLNDNKVPFEEKYIL
jgi:putative transposase